MNPDRLEKLLADYSAQPLPLSSEASTTAIWREIERRRQQSLWLRLATMLDLRDFFSQPRMAVAALAFAVTIGVVPAAAFNRLENERRLARQSIHFEVFSDDAGVLGSVFAKPVALVTNSKR